MRGLSDKDLLHINKARSDCRLENLYNSVYHRILLIKRRAKRSPYKKAIFLHKTIQFTPIAAGNHIDNPSLFLYTFGEIEITFG